MPPLRDKGYGDLSMVNPHSGSHRTPRQRFADLEEGLRWNFEDRAEPVIVALREAIAAMEAQQLERLREADQAAKLDRQRAIRSVEQRFCMRDAWATFLSEWLDYNHGKGESDRAWDEFVSRTT
jgi:hypothetical protein